MRRVPVRDLVAMGIVDELNVVLRRHGMFIVAEQGVTKEHDQIWVEHLAAPKPTAPTRCIHGCDDEDDY